MRKVMGLLIAMVFSVSVAFAGDKVEKKKAELKAAQKEERDAKVAERKAKIEFSKPYLNNRQIIMVVADSTITGKDMLKGKIVGLQLGSSSENALNEAADLKKSLKDIKKYENNTLALMDLASKRVDAVVIDEIVGRWNMAKKPGAFKVLNDDHGKELYGVGIRKTDITFKEALDKALDEIKSDKAGEEISKKWF